MESRKPLIVLIEPVGGHGGMELYDYGLAQGLSKSDSTVHFFTGEKTRESHYENVHTHFSFGKIWSTKFPPLKLWRFLKGYCKAFRFAKSHNAIAVHVHFFDLGRLNNLVLWISGFYRIPIFITLHDISTLSGKAVHSGTQNLVKYSKGIIVHNEFSRKELLFRCPEVSQKCVVLPHGSYLHAIQQLPAREKRTISQESPLRLLFFGQIKPTKGLDILLEAMAILHDQNMPVHLTIAGKPWQMDIGPFEAIIQGKGLDPIIKRQFRYIADDEVAGFYEEADLVILPYTKIYQSGVLLLSMSYGRPVLCSDLPAFQEIITDGKEGFLFQVNNANDLALNIQEILLDPSVLVAVDSNARNLIKQTYSWDSIAKKTLLFYQQQSQ